MASVLLPPAKAAKGFVDSAIAISKTAKSAGSGYGLSIAPAVTALVSATTSINTIQAFLIPVGAIAPPSKIGVNITGSILAQIVTVNATIAATTAQSVAAVGAPSPTFPSSAALVNTQLKAISSAIKLGLIIPQQI